MIDPKIIAKINELNCKIAYTESGKTLRWNGIVPDDIEMVAPFMNVFASKKNLDKWLDMCGVVKDELDNLDEPNEPIIEPVVPVDEPVDEPIDEPIDEPKDLTLDIDLSAKTKKEIAVYAMDTYKIELNIRDTKEIMIQKLEDSINGVHD